MIDTLLLEQLSGKSQAEIIEWIQHLQSTADKRKELLRELEWVKIKTGKIEIVIEVCLICKGLRPYGHNEDCRLEKEIKENV